MSTLADSNLTERSSVKVCDTFKVNILLVSPDRKYIIAGTKDSDDLSPKVFFVFFDYLIFFVAFPALVCPCELLLFDTVEKGSSLIDTIKHIVPRLYAQHGK